MDTAKAIQIEKMFHFSISDVQKKYENTNHKKGQFLVIIFGTST